MSFCHSKFPAQEEHLAGSFSPGVLAALPAGLPGASKSPAQSDSLGWSQSSWPRTRQSLARGQGRRSSSRAAKSGAAGASRPLPGDGNSWSSLGWAKTFPRCGTNDAKGSSGSRGPLGGGKSQQSQEKLNTKPSNARGEEEEGDEGRGAGSAPLAPAGWALPQGGEGKVSGAATKMQLFGAVSVPGGLGLLLLPPAGTGSS